MPPPLRSAPYLENQNLKSSEDRLDPPESNADLGIKAITK